MNAKKNFSLSIISLLIFYSFGLAQKSSQHEKDKSWQLLDYQQDSIYGTSANKAYKTLLKGKKSHPIIVAVIDAGVDINHEDLQGHIWTNEKEIAGNGIDDDHNGYIDDIHGWNFLGGKDGTMMYATSSEADREYARLYPKYSNVNDTTSAEDRQEFQYFLRSKEKHIRDSSERKDMGAYTRAATFIGQIAALDSEMQKSIGKQHLYAKDIAGYEPKDSAGKMIKMIVLSMMKNPPQVGYDTTALDNIVADGMKFTQQLKEQQSLYALVKYDPNQLRKEIVGDDPFDIHDTYYGNNIVGDKYAEHGTHCAGIIAAVRNNAIGTDGITDNVLIMPVRAANTLTNGDERDKDIALAIRYAVDNGARIISMSFGKYFSPQKEWVDDAIRYAEKKNVLLIHAAGNNSKNMDSAEFYPTRHFVGSPDIAGNIITVGAITNKTDEHLPASFSNYGNNEVDIFAPGDYIYSTIPNNKYEMMGGTSMATPTVAGVAALIMEYYPQLTALEVKDILLKSVTSLKGKMVLKPGTKEMVDFASLCRSGGVVNAYNALKMAEEIAIKMKK